MLINPKVKIVSSGAEVSDAVNFFLSVRYQPEDIYVLAHDKFLTKTIAKQDNANHIGFLEEGILASLSNIFRSDGDQLRTKLKSMGFNQSEADKYEVELDKGKILVIAFIK